MARFLGVLGVMLMLATFLDVAAGPAGVVAWHALAGGGLLLLIAVAGEPRLAPLAGAYLLAALALAGAHPLAVVTAVHALTGGAAVVAPLGGLLTARGTRTASP